jgi:hypothetical protein
VEVPTSSAPRAETGVRNFCLLNTPISKPSTCRRRNLCPSESHELCLSLPFFLSTALQPFGPWPLFHFFNPIRSRQNSLDGLSAHRRAATYTWQHKHRINAHRRPCFESSGIRNHDPSVRAGEGSWCLRPRGHCHWPHPHYKHVCWKIPQRHSFEIRLSCPIMKLASKQRGN